MYIYLWKIHIYTSRKYFIHISTKILVISFSLMMMPSIHIPVIYVCLPSQSLNGKIISLEMCFCCMGSVQFCGYMYEKNNFQKCVCDTTPCFSIDILMYSWRANTCIGKVYPVEKWINRSLRIQIWIRQWRSWI